MRRIVSLAVLVLVVFLAGPRSFSLPLGGYGDDLVNNYYSDNTYSNAVGSDERDCNGLFGSGGTATSWRYHEVYSCDTLAETSANCQEYQPGVGWVNVACPNETVTIQTRVHIPVGR